MKEDSRHVDHALRHALNVFKKNVLSRSLQHTIDLNRGSKTEYINKSRLSRPSVKHGHVMSSHVVPVVRVVRVVHCLLDNEQRYGPKAPPRPHTEVSEVGGCRRMSEVGKEIIHHMFNLKQCYLMSFENLSIYFVYFDLL